MLCEVQSSIKDQDLLSQKRAILADAAAKKFFKKGYERTTIQDIAEASGMSVGSIYRYIGKKEDIFTLMLDSVIQIVNKDLVPLKNLRMEPEAKLKVIFEKYCEIVNSYSKYFVIIIRENRSMDTHQREVIRSLEGTITACFMCAINDGVEKQVFTSLADEFWAYNLLVLGQQWTMRKYHYKDLSLDDFIMKQTVIIEKIFKYINK